MAYLNPSDSRIFEIAFTIHMWSKTLDDQVEGNIIDL
jgi:hypothetical protein